jgi:glutaredoxin
MKQQCYVAAIYLNWIVLAAGLVFLFSARLYFFALAWIVALPLALWGYVRVFPSISQAMGYGRMDDKPCGAVSPVYGEVRLYTALGCPFCPVVKQRLLALAAEMGFTLTEIDVTLKPGLLAAKGIRAVPVVEAGERRLAGNATSEQLAELISQGVKAPKLEAVGTTSK